MAFRRSELAAIGRKAPFPDSSSRRGLPQSRKSGKRPLERNQFRWLPGARPPEHTDVHIYTRRGNEGAHRHRQRDHRLQDRGAGGRRHHR
jgi:hypothetical protein